MLKSEIQNLLDSMLLPIKEVKQNINANKSLTIEQKEKLWTIVYDFELSYKTYDYKKALQEIALMMQTYQSETQIIIEKDSKINIMSTSSKTMPYMIKQVLFYIVVMCKKHHKISQKEVLTILREHGVTLSHNFFSGNLFVTPIQYIQMEEYKQIASPIKYKGKKDGKLGIAIKYLTYQAGKYNNFVDIFGGSGAGILAVSKRKEVTYVYNEKNKMVYNLMKVISDEEMYIQLINALESLQIDLKGEGEWLENVDWDNEIEVYYNSKRNNDKKEDRIIYDNVSSIDIDFLEVVSYMKEIKKDLLQEKEEFTLVFEENTYTKEELLEGLFVDFGTAYMKDYGLFMSFIYHFRLIYYYAGRKMDSIQGMVYKGSKDSIENVSLNSRLEEFRQYRFYKYYAYFSNLLKGDGKEKLQGQEVLYAVAEVYKQFFRCNGEMGVSPILRMIWMPKEKHSISKDWEKFLKEDFSKTIMEVHIALQRVQLENKDYKEIISIFDDKKTLFYSDSPYLTTSNYKDEVNGVGDFSELDVQCLIDRLFGNCFTMECDSELEDIRKKREKILKEKKLMIKSNNKFIFSCRAVKSFRNDCKRVKQLQKDNQIILQYVFGTFLDYVIHCNVSLYVLAIETQEKALFDLIKENKKAELMITNFEIFPFQYKTTKFVVYSFEEFFKGLLNSTNMIIEKEGVMDFYVNK